MRTLTRRIPDITAPFARFTGRQRLSPYDRAIIHALERQRLSGLTIRAHIVDRPGHDSTHLLTHYINWLLSLTPDSIIAIQDRNKRDARQVARQLHTLRHLRPLLASVRCPNALRGASFDVLLVRGSSARLTPLIHSSVNSVFPFSNPRFACIYLTPAGRKPKDIPSLPELYTRLGDTPPPPLTIQTPTQPPILNIINPNRLTQPKRLPATKAPPLELPPKTLSLAGAAPLKNAA